MKALFYSSTRLYKGFEAQLFLVYLLPSSEVKQKHFVLSPLQPKQEPRECVFLQCLIIISVFLGLYPAGS